MEAINLTMPQLVSAWNNLVVRAHQLGLDTYKPLNSKFKTLEVGAARLEKLESAIRAREASERAVTREETVAPAEVPVAPVEDMPVEIPPAVTAEAVAPATEEDEMARRKAKAKAKRAPKQSHANGTSIKAKTEEFNSLVSAAKKAGVAWARTHTSDFGSHEAADKMLKRLKQEIAAAR